MVTEMQNSNNVSLSRAYELLEAGRPMEALSIVLEHLRAMYDNDEARVFAAIRAAKEAHSASVRTRAEEELLLGAIADQLSHLSLQETDESSYILSILQCDSSFLGQAGRSQILVDAHSDGSSVICPDCHQLIASARWQQHRQFWCPALPHDDDDEDSDTMS